MHAHTTFSSSCSHICTKTLESSNLITILLSLTGFALVLWQSQCQLMGCLPRSLLFHYHSMVLQAMCFACCLLHAVSCLPNSSTLEMEATCSSKTSAHFHQTTMHCTPEERSLNNHGKNLKSYNFHVPHILTQPYIPPKNPNGTQH
jgi:hypothetical protein